MASAKTKNQPPLLAALASGPTAELSPAPCQHDRAIPGLDAHYCPTCRRPIAAHTAEYRLILER